MRKTASLVGWMMTSSWSYWWCWFMMMPLPIFCVMKKMKNEKFPPTHFLLRLIGTSITCDLSPFSSPEFLAKLGRSSTDSMTGVPDGNELTYCNFASRLFPVWCPHLYLNKIFARNSTTTTTSKGWRTSSGRSSSRTWKWVPSPCNQDYL